MRQVIPPLEDSLTISNIISVKRDEPISPVSPKTESPEVQEFKTKISHIKNQEHKLDSFILNLAHNDRLANKNMQNPVLKADQVTKLKKIGLKKS